MPRRRPASALVALLVVVAASGCGHSGSAASAQRRPASPSSAPPADESALPASVTGELQKALSAALSYGVPGIQAAVVTDHGTWQGAAGVDGLQAPVRPDALMAVGSVSKTFTAAEVLHLAAERQLDLDAPLSHYLHSPLVGNGATVRQALGMLAGLTDGQYMRRTKEGSARTPNARISLDDAIATDTETPGAAGQTQTYSNVSFLLLARLVEAATHRSYAQAVHADLLEPAGLTRVVVQDSDKPVAPLAYPVDSNGTKPLTDGCLPDRYTASAAIGAGSIAASAHDVALWGYDLYVGRVLPQPLTAAMMKPQCTGDFPYGLGAVVFDPGKLGIGAPAVGHTGEIEHDNGSGIDGYRSILIVVPGRHVSVAVTVDSATGYGPQGTAVTLLRTVLS